MLASLAPGETRIIGASGARHVRSTIEVLRGLGTRIEQDETGFVVHGRPVPPAPQLGVRRQLGHHPLLHDRPRGARRRARSTLTGQKYFQRRPVGPLLGALAQLGVRLESQDARPPITVQPRAPPAGTSRIAGTLSQWISGLLLLAPVRHAARPSSRSTGVLNEQPYVELTVRMMRDFGLEVGVSDDWRRFEIEPGQEAQADGDRPAARHRLGGVRARRQRAASLRRPLPADAHDVGTEIDHPEAHVLDVLQRDGPADGARRGGRRGPGAPRRHRAARRRASTAGRCPTCCRSSRRSGPSRPAGPCSRTSSTSA